MLFAYFTHLLNHFYISYPENSVGVVSTLLQGSAATSPLCCSKSSDISFCYLQLQPDIIDQHIAFLILHPAYLGIVLFLCQQKFHIHSNPLTSYLATNLPPSVLSGFLAQLMQSLINYYTIVFPLPMYIRTMWIVAIWQPLFLGKKYNGIINCSF